MPHVVWKLCVARCVSSSAFSPLPVACRLVHAWFHVAHFQVVSCTLSLALSAALLTVARVCCTFSLHVVCFLLPATHVAWRALPVACPTSHHVTLHGLRCESSIACCMLLCCESSVACCACMRLHACVRVGSERDGVLVGWLCVRREYLCQGNRINAETTATCLRS